MLLLKQLLIEAVKRTKEIGSSTAVIAKIEKEKDDMLLKTCNLGDSGYVIFRAPISGSKS